MRSDSSQPKKEFRASRQWQFNALAGQFQPEIASRYRLGRQSVGDRFQWHSFSGKERNRLFLNLQGQRFKDVSALSGLDNIADSRSFVVWDYDRDGRQDIALVNANRPLLNIYRNQIQHHGANDRPPIIALKFVGGNETASVSSAFGPRDGYGARVTIHADQLKVMREFRCGEGFAAQNSDTMVIGIGDHAQADSVTVDWPSGKTQTIAHVPAGSLLQVYENPSSSPNGHGFVQSTYAEPQPSVQKLTTRRSTPEVLALENEVVKADPADLRMFTTMATWCAACQSHLPQLDRLRLAIATDQLSMYGLPMDAIETSLELDEYVKQHQPAYRLLIAFSGDDRSRVQKAILRTLDTEALPTTIITNRAGKVLEMFAGVPTVSAVRRTIAEVRRADRGRN